MSRNSTKNSTVYFKMAAIGHRPERTITAGATGSTEQESWAFAARMDADEEAAGLTVPDDLRQAFVMTIEAARLLAVGDPETGARVLGLALSELGTQP